MKSIYDFVNKISKNAQDLIYSVPKVHNLYGNMSTNWLEWAIELENKVYKVEHRDIDGFLYGYYDVSVNIPDIEACKEEITKCLSDYNKYVGQMKVRREVAKREREFKNTLDCINCTMITPNEVHEMLKDIGCAICQSKGVKVQEWANEEKTRYWIKARHTIKKIKCRVDGNTYCKEDILAAIT